ncbi:hypothetical protein [Paraliomyxa miuraensis]|uniref:hypothetical protein n=1 Tax=Paraliomyxa miuraensis TaxID=376150 RepID=UPI0022536FEC|nr:hypothetical protein [Paraliomyxa miuraensis]MCX4240844.1 hypothetical protein [Paraliomyxa miuraensis]
MTTNSEVVNPRTVRMSTLAFIETVLVSAVVVWNQSGCSPNKTLDERQTQLDAVNDDLPPAPPEARPDAPSGANDTAAHEPSKGACGREHPMFLEGYEGSPGVRGRFSAGESLHEGWMLLDTGNTLTKIRGNAEGTVDVGFELAPGLERRLLAGYDPFVGIRAPAGGQAALIGTDLLGGLAVRLDFDEGQVLFATDELACSDEELRRMGYHRFDTDGYYQRDANWASVGKYLAPNVPTIEVEILGKTVRMQIDTGYSGAALHVQLNKPLFELIRDELGPSIGKIEVGRASLESYELPAGSLKFHDADSRDAIAMLGAATALVKEGDESIAAWDVPAAMLSVAALSSAFSSVELRADLEDVWVMPRATP